MVTAYMHSLIDTKYYSAFESDDGVILHVSDVRSLYPTHPVTDGDIDFYVQYV